MSVIPADAPFWPELQSLHWACYPIVIGSFLAFLAVYLLSPYVTRAIGFGSVYDALSADGKIEWSARVLSTVHALVCSQGAIRVILSFPDPSDPLLTTELSTFYTSVTYGYFLLDLALCVWHYRIFQAPFLIHGLVCSVAFAIMVTTGFLAYFACVFALWELSTPCVNVRGFMSDAGLKSHWFYNVNALCLYLVFTVARLCVGIPAIVVCWSGLYAHYHRVGGFLLMYYQFAACVTTCLNLWWWGRMTKMIAAKCGFLSKPRAPTAVATAAATATSGEPSPVGSAANVRVKRTKKA